MATINGQQLNTRQRGDLPGVLYAIGFSSWKKPVVRNFLAGCEVRFVDRYDAVPAGEPIVVWGQQDYAEHAVNSERSARLVIRLEDGFLRSVGLGADLIRPVSWVKDLRGIYYDASRPSDLEHLLQHQVVDRQLLERASILRKRIVAAGLTKYNVGSGGWERPRDVATVILVPGQVESDASIAFGVPQISGAVRTNIDLLRTVRLSNRDAYVLYKPHPDVLAGLRTPGHNEAMARQWCDELVKEVSIAELLDQVDEVHVMTSLTGFEALLRCKAVTCYGQPFYAGWGLTTDVLPVERRTRRLLLDELVAGALIGYPSYIDRVTGQYTTPEQALDQLLAWRAEGVELPWWRKLFRRILWFYRR